MFIVVVVVVVIIVDGWSWNKSSLIALRGAGAREPNSFTLQLNHFAITQSPKQFSTDVNFIYCYSMKCEWQ
jgi:hypothetical protein